MVKFIPLTCEVCGGELSVKEDSKYVTCLHCHTKFQVLQENSTAYLEKLEVNVNVQTNSYRETCEIKYELYYGFLGNSIELWAAGLGKDGEFTAGQTWKVRGNSPDITTGNHKDAYRCLVVLLSRSGWIKTGEGRLWFNDSFERHETSDSAQRRVYELEKEFGENLFATINKDRGEVEDYLLQQGVLKKVWPYRDEKHVLVSAVYGLTLDKLVKTFNVPADSQTRSSYQKLISIRKEIESLKK